MRGISKITGFLASGMFLSNLFFVANDSWAQLSDDLLKEAKIIEKLEDGFFNKRLKNDLKGAYEYQHPIFKEKISLEEYLYFEGRVTTQYRNTTMAHISGGRIPSVDYIRKNYTKKDILGFPRPHFYKWYINPYVIVKQYELEKISISKDGKYAMVDIVLKGNERINPAMVRGDISFNMKRPHTDYWEKVDGKWVITVLADETSISGGMRTLYFIPNNNDSWEKKDYVQIDPSSLMANPDPERHALNQKE